MSSEELLQPLSYIAAQLDKSDRNVFAYHVQLVGLY